jgi:hypothetical protein
VDRADGRCECGRGAEPKGAEHLGQTKVDTTTQQPHTPAPYSSSRARSRKDLPVCAHSVHGNCARTVPTFSSCSFSVEYRRRASSLGAVLLRCVRGAGFSGETSHDQCVDTMLRR